MSPCLRHMCLHLGIGVVGSNYSPDTNGLRVYPLYLFRHVWLASSVWISGCVTWSCLLFFSKSLGGNTNLVKMFNSLFTSLLAFTFASGKTNLAPKIEASISRLLEDSKGQCDFWIDLLRLHVGKNDSNFCEQGLLNEALVFGGDELPGFSWLLNRHWNSTLLGPLFKNYTIARLTELPYW